MFSKLDWSIVSIESTQTNGRKKKKKDPVRPRFDRAISLTRFRRKSRRCWDSHTHTHTHRCVISRVRNRKEKRRSATSGRTAVLITTLGSLRSTGVARMYISPKAKAHPFCRRTLWFSNCQTRLLSLDTFACLLWQESRTRRRTFKYAEPRQGRLKQVIIERARFDAIPTIWVENGRDWFFTTVSTTVWWFFTGIDNEKYFWQRQFRMNTRITEA